MERGNQIHKLAEDYLKGSISRLPPELKPLEAEFKRLRAVYKKRLSGMTVEDTWAFTKDWTRTVWNDWVGCWVRIKLDAAHPEDDTLIVTDWKTGKYRDEDVELYIEQLELYALAGLMLHPHLKAVRPRLGYTDQGRFYPGEGDDVLEFTQADVPRLKKLWEKRVGPMFKDRRFAPRANSKCKWCYYGQAGKKICKF